MSRFTSLIFVWNENRSAVAPLATGLPNEIKDEPRRAGDETSKELESNGQRRLLGSPKVYRASLGYMAVVPNVMLEPPSSEACICNKVPESKDLSVLIVMDKVWVIDCQLAEKDVAGDKS